MELGPALLVAAIAHEIREKFALFRAEKLRSDARPVECLKMLSINLLQFVSLCNHFPNRNILRNILRRKLPNKIPLRLIRLNHGQVSATGFGEGAHGNVF